MLLAREGVALRDTAQTRGNLLAALLKSPAAIGVIRGVGAVTDHAISPTGRTVWAAVENGRSHLIDVPARRSTAPSPLQGAGIANFDHAGVRVATVDEPQRSGKRMAGPCMNLPIYDASFSADDRELFLLQEATVAHDRAATRRLAQHRLRSERRAWSSPDRWEKRACRRPRCSRHTMGATS